MTISANFPNVQPSLLLDFANAKQLPPQVTFTRATTATYYDGSTTAKAEQNLAYPSASAGGGTWANTTNITNNAGTAPDGTNTAMSYASGGGGYIRIVSTPGITYTMSVYVKNVSATALYFQALQGSPSITYLYDVNRFSDINTSTWTRLTATFSSGSATAIQFYIGPNGGSALVWGWQIEERSSATAYTATTTQAITNYNPVLLTAGGGQPRFDHNPTTSESLGLLAEEQRTNLITNSGNLSAGTWSVSNLTVTGNTIVAPDGTLTGGKIILNAGSTGYVGQSIGVSAGSTVYTVYFKAGEYRRVSLWEGAVSAVNVTFDLISGTIVGQNSATALMTSVGNGWYRCSMISTQTAGGRFWLISPVGDTSTTPFTPATTGNGFNGVYAWGAQLEQAAFPTSYIPTTSAAATRAVDLATMSGANVSSWYNQAQGTLYINIMYIGGLIGSAQETNSVWIDDGSSANRIALRTVRDLTTPQADMTIASAGSINLDTGGYGPVTTGVAYKQGASYTTTTASHFVNTVSDVTNAVCIAPLNVTRLVLNGSASGAFYLNKLSYYPASTTAAQLQALTS